MLKIHVTAFALALAAAAPLAYAQTATHSIQTDEIRASKMIGSAVYDVQNRKIGSVQDLVLDKDGLVAAVVVDVGAFLGMGGKDVAVKLSDIKTDNNRLTLDLTKEKLQQMAAYQLENRNTGALYRIYTAPYDGSRRQGFWLKA